MPVLFKVPDIHEHERIRQLGYFGSHEEESRRRGVDVRIIRGVVINAPLKNRDGAEGSCEAKKPVIELVK